jgi:drug/metabolite transporter (DMT)-like permease
VTPHGLTASPYAAATAAMLFWAGSFVVVRGVALEVPPIGLSFWRAVLAALVFTAWAWPHLRADLAGLNRRWKELAALGITQNALVNAASVVALHTTTVINASVINAMVAVLIVLFAWAIYRETVTVRQAAGIVVSLAGALALISRADIGVIRELAFTEGDLWILLAVANWALYAVTVRRFTAGLHPVSALAAMCWWSVAELLPFYAWEHFAVEPVTLDRDFFSSVLYLALLPSVACVFLWTRTLQLLGPQRAAAFQYLIPVFSVAFAIGLLDERLETFHLAGAALVAAGIWLTAISGKAKTR